MAAIRDACLFLKCPNLKGKKILLKKKKNYSDNSADRKNDSAVRKHSQGNNHLYCEGSSFIFVKMTFE